MSADRKSMNLKKAVPPDTIPSSATAAPENVSTFSIWIVNEIGIGGTLRTLQVDGPFSFRVNDAVIGPVDVTVAADGTRVSSRATVSVSETLLRELESDILLHEMQQGMSDEFGRVTRSLSHCCRRVVRLLEQEMRVEDLRSDSLFHIPNGLRWSRDGENWRIVRGGHCVGGLRTRPLFKLDAQWQRKIQALLDSGEVPLLAVRQLYEAIRSGSARISWVEATIAAELAIKEILVKMEPSLETLLTHVPSPPLQKLYGEVLESVCGRRSSFRSDLGKGATQRNVLVHGAEEFDAHPQKVVDYLQVVENAIYELIDMERQCRQALSNGPNQNTSTT